MSIKERCRGAPSVNERVNTSDGLPTLSREHCAAPPQMSIPSRRVWRLALIGTLTKGATIKPRSIVQHRPRCTDITLCTYEALRTPRPPPPDNLDEIAITELKVVVKPAGDMGMGSYAAEDGDAGAWVCQYVGEPITLIETTYKYTEEDPAYLFQITPDLYLDAQDSTHHSRFFNHAQHGNLNFTVDVERQRIDFWLKRDVRAGEQLMFDYGMAYWLGSGITPLGDTRNFTRHAPRSGGPTGPKPITPTNREQLTAVLALAEEHARPSLLRALEYFGGVRLGERAQRIPFGLGEGAPTLDVDPTEVQFEVLHKAAAACIAQAEAMVEEPASDAVVDTVHREHEAALATRWLSNSSPFATSEHDAVGVVALWLWSFPDRYRVRQPLSTERWEELLGMLRQDEGGTGAVRVREQLVREHSDDVESLMSRARELMTAVPPD